MEFDFYFNILCKQFNILGKQCNILGKVNVPVKNKYRILPLDLICKVKGEIN